MDHATADEAANDAATACLPRDLLANVLLRLPASDLRRLRRVCKEWRDVISDPLFVNEHMEHGPWTPTHTIVFLRGRSGAEPRNGHGFLFDEHWRLVATFTAGESEGLVGTCNGLLCFVDAQAQHGAINVVEPFTGESLALPLPPTRECVGDPGAYCFGFDRGSRRYKIFHLGLDFLEDGTTEQDLYVYTVGGGDNGWRSVARVAGAAEPGVFHRGPTFAGGDGSLYWSVDADQLGKVARFDLATEEITSETVVDLRREEDEGKALHVMTGSGSPACVMTVGWFGEWETFSMEEGEGRHDCRRPTRNGSSGGGVVELPNHRSLALPQAVQRGHLVLLEGYRDAAGEAKVPREAGVYVHPITPERDGDLGLGSGKLLLKMGEDKDKVPAEGSTHPRGLFVPAMPNQVPAKPGRVRNELIGSFCYAPPVAPAPLALPRGFPPQTTAENKVTTPTMYCRS